MLDYLLLKRCSTVTFLDIPTPLVLYLAFNSLGAYRFKHPSAWATLSIFAFKITTPWSIFFPSEIALLGSLLGVDKKLKIKPSSFSPEGRRCPGPSPSPREIQFNVGVIVIHQTPSCIIFFVSGKSRIAKEIKHSAAAILLSKLCLVSTIG